MVEGKSLREVHGQWIFAKEIFGATKKARYGVLMHKVKNGFFQLCGLRKYFVYYS